jgi:hypothetical protein
MKTVQAYWRSIGAEHSPEAHDAVLAGARNRGLTVVAHSASQGVKQTVALRSRIGWRVASLGLECGHARR